MSQSQPTCMNNTSGKSQGIFESADKSPGRKRHANVGKKERLASALAGGALVFLGLRRRGWLGSLLAVAGGSMVYRAATGYCPAYQAMGINRARTAQASAAPRDYFEQGIHVDERVTINRPRAELYRFWRQFDNLPRFMNHLVSVRMLDNQRSHWVAKGPAGTQMEWDAQIINEQLDELIAWRSLDHAQVDNAGSVRFIDSSDGQGVEVRVVLEYIPPAGRLGQVVARLFGREPAQQVRKDLQRFKAMMETGGSPAFEAQI